MAGKIQKTKLAALVRKFRSEHDAATADVAESQLDGDVKSIWAKAVGIPLKNLRIDDPLSEVADSITVMRVRDKIKRQTGKTLSLAEMADSRTIAGQIKLLKSQPVANAKDTTHQRVIRQGPPGVEDMAHLTEDPDLFEPTKEVVSKALAVHGLGWEDVEDGELLKVIFATLNANHVQSCLHMTLPMSWPRWAISTLGASRWRWCPDMSRRRYCFNMDV